MNREYKIGDEVIYSNISCSNMWEDWNGNSLYGKIAKIIKISNNFCLLEFKENTNSNYDGLGEGKEGHCWWCDKNEFKLAIDHIKFKKWIKG